MKYVYTITINKNLLEEVQYDVALDSTTAFDEIEKFDFADAITKIERHLPILTLEEIEENYINNK